jgi:hypothetical protein
VANLMSGANGVPRLDATTVHSNGATNTLTGGTDLDLFFAALGDKVLKRAPGSILVTLP